VSIPAIGTRYDIARTRLDLARVARRRADRDAARTHLGEALRLFVASSVPHHADRTRRLAAELDVTRPQEAAP